MLQIGFAGSLWADVADVGLTAEKVKPEYRPLANQNDITSKISNRLISLRYTDEAGMESDILEITLADHDSDNPI